MPRTRFPEWKGKKEREIKTWLRRQCLDTSYHSDYNIHYALGSFVDTRMHRLNIWDAEEHGYFRPHNKFVEDDACFGSLPGLIRRFKRDDKNHAKPVTLAMSFRLDPFSYGIDCDDYYWDEEDEYDPDEMVDLSEREIMWYSKWLIKHGIMPHFDIASFIDTETVYVPFQYWNNLNAMYFSLTMFRYMHEGQNICRRILEFDELFDLDPFVNIAMAHWFAEGCYNSGHCACDCSYWRMERFYDHPDRRNLTNEIKNCAQLYLARIAQSMYTTLINLDDDWDIYNIGDYGDHPHFEWERSVSYSEMDLKMITPTTWRGLCRYTCK